MIEIALLGRVAVTVAGQPLAGEAAQRRRLALLALLCDVDLRPVSRDRLTAYLWPENDAESARHLLSASLHVLRKALGADAILASSDQVALNPAVARVDAIEFETAVRRAELERAASLYRGVFADGLFISGASEFEHWLDSRRAELARHYATALEHCVAAHTERGELEQAVAVSRKLAALDPYSGRNTLALMRSLVRAGQRATALQVARSHAQLLDTEFGATPDSDVTRFAEALRREPNSSETPAVTQHADAGSNAIASSTEQTSVESPEPYGSIGPPPTAADMGAAATTQHARVSTMQRPRVLVLSSIVAMVAIVIALIAREPRLETIAVVPQSQGVADDANLYISTGLAEGIHNRLRSLPPLNLINSASSFLFRDSTVGVQRIGRALAADAVLLVSARALGDSVRIHVQLARTRDGVVLWDTLPSMNRAELFSLADGLSAAVAAALQVRLAPPSAPAREGGTTNAVAQEFYWEARELWRRRTPAALQAALVLFQRAIARDPGYALAHVGLADTYNLLGSFEYGVLPPDSAYPAARAAANSALALVPEFPPALAALANVRMNYDREWVAAEENFQRAIELDPNYAEAREWLAMLLISRGRADDALNMLRRAQQNNGQSPLLFTNLAQHYYLRGDYQTAHEHIEQALSLDATFSRAHALRALVLCAQERAHEAVPLLEQMAAHSGDDPLLAGLLGYAYARADRRDDAVGRLTWLQELRRNGRYIPIESMAMIQVGLNHVDETLDLLEQAADARSSGMIYLSVEPILTPLHNHPRYQSLVQRVHQR